MLPFLCFIQLIIMLFLALLGLLLYGWLSQLLYVSQHYNIDLLFQIQDNVAWEFIYNMFRDNVSKLANFDFQIFDRS